MYIQWKRCISDCREILFIVSQRWQIYFFLPPPSLKFYCFVTKIISKVCLCHLDKKRIWLLELILDIIINLTNLCFLQKKKCTIGVRSPTKDSKILRNGLRFRSHERRNYPTIFQIKGKKNRREIENIFFHLN